MTPSLHERLLSFAIYLADRGIDGFCFGIGLLAAVCLVRMIGVQVFS